MDVQHRELGEQRLADELAEGADDDRLRLSGADPLQRRLGSLTFAACSSSSPSSPRGVGGRRRRSLAAAALAAVGRRDDERRAVGRVGEAAQDRGGEVRGAEVGGPHASVRGSRSSRPRRSLPRRRGCSCRPRAAPAAPPCAARGWCGRGSGRRRGGRSRAGGRAPRGPTASITIGSPLGVAAADARVQRPLDVHRRPAAG